MALRAFEDIRARAEARKGVEAIAAQLPTVKTPAELAAIPDDRWLSTMSRCVFQAGFAWTVVEQKWPGTEAAFWGFSPARCRAMSDEAFDGLLKDSRIIRNGAKVRSVQNNAAFIMDLATEHARRAGSSPTGRRATSSACSTCSRRAATGWAAMPAGCSCASWARTAGSPRSPWSRR